jgi:hypothetical protein
MLWSTTAMTESDESGSAQTTVIELRQYKIVPGMRGFLIDLFEREFIESQEALGMRLIGQFVDRNDPNRFTWMRQFPNMKERRRALEAFYSGPVWLAHRGEANPTLEDNDNVLLLRPATPDLAFGQFGASRAAPGELPRGAGIVFVTIHYLWKDPREGFTEFFRTRMMPELAASGMHVIAAYVPERTPNDFPRLPVRQAENVFVWFTRIAGIDALEAAQYALASRSSWMEGVMPVLADFEERESQRLILEPTPRSALR